MEEGEAIEEDKRSLPIWLPSYYIDLMNEAIQTQFKAYSGGLKLPYYVPISEEYLLGDTNYQQDCICELLKEVTGCEWGHIKPNIKQDKRLELPASEKAKDIEFLVTKYANDYKQFCQRIRGIVTSTLIGSKAGSTSTYADTIDKPRKDPEQKMNSESAFIFTVLKQLAVTSKGLCLEIQEALWAKIKASGVEETGVNYPNIMGILLEFATIFNNYLLFSLEVSSHLQSVNDIINEVSKKIKTKEEEDE